MGSVDRIGDINPKQLATNAPIVLLENLKGKKPRLLTLSLSYTNKLVTFGLTDTQRGVLLGVTRERNLRSKIR
jgi:hypothetical protein